MFEDFRFSKKCKETEHVREKEFAAREMELRVIMFDVAWESRGG